ncbi:MAG: TetR/AcrR family transcriptional regulator [Bacteroidota bacterium]
MKGQKKQEWIEKGYELVAKDGFNCLGVELMAKVVNKSKSSFYHYFGDLDGFKEELLKHHLTSSHYFAQRVAQCKNIHPETLEVLLEHQTDVFFHKQLRINRGDLGFEQYIEKVFEIYEMAIVDKWIAYFDLQKKTLFVRTFNRFITEHFCLLITQESYTYDWLANYVQQLAEMLQQMKAEE